MEDQELLALKDLKTKLLKKAYNLVKKLKEQEQDGHQQLRGLNLALISNTKCNALQEDKIFEEDKSNLCEISRYVSGITFDNVDKKWLHDNIYCYTTCLELKKIKFYVDLTVAIKEQEDFEILDITCHLINIDKCCIAEISPWVQTITRAKNFSLLTCAVFQYNEGDKLRTKIIRILEAQNYGTSQQSTDERGGILIHIHSPNNMQLEYLTFHWSLMFMEKLWRIQHFFTINSMDGGCEFVEKNLDLLQSFCKARIKDNEILSLWKKLCLAIDDYENVNKPDED